MTGHRPPTAAELAFIASRRVARLATIDDANTPVVFPICYALIEGDDGAPLVVSPLDEKPKSAPARELQRVRNILAHPRVGLVVDDYADDWNLLAQTRLQGTARLVEPGGGEHVRATAALRARYPQYQRMAIEREPVIAIGELQAWSWKFSPEPADDRPEPRVDLPLLDTVIRGRRSVRAFSPRPVPAAVIRAAIDAAGWAPSPHGRQPWRFAVVERAERRQALAEAMSGTWRAQLQFDGQDQAILERRLARSRERLETAPVLITPCLYLDDLDVYPDPERQTAETTMAVQSIGAAIQNLLLSLYASGVDGGWMCAPLFCPEIVRDALGLPEALHPHALIAVGYAAADPVRRPRRPLDDLIVSWD